MVEKLTENNAVSYYIGLEAGRDASLFKKMALLPKYMPLTAASTIVFFPFVLFRKKNTPQFDPVRILMYSSILSSIAWYTFRYEKKFRDEHNMSFMKMRKKQKKGEEID
ncbi:hypothetical protein MHBO_001545 [Bonamia ostreae]|uniref:Uncharacterized protein n=1 Tax=Bonamia ostreae TaxID=126728 RepID=A0ABV2AJC6_9EUKA